MNKVTFNVSFSNSYSRTHVISVAIPSLAPTITSVQRTSGTSARITWDPIPHQYRNGDLTAYHLTYLVAVNGSCVDTSGDQQTTLTSADDSSSVGFLINLDSLQEYCVRIAGATVHGVGVFGRYWKIPCKPKNLIIIMHANA